MKSMPAEYVEVTESRRKLENHCSKLYVEKIDHVVLKANRLGIIGS